MPFDMPGWAINAGLIVASAAALIGGMRSVITDLQKRLDAIQTTTSETSSRLVKLETRLEALDAMRFDERIRLLEVAVAVSERSHRTNGAPQD